MNTDTMRRILGYVPCEENGGEGGGAGGGEPKPDNGGEPNPENGGEPKPDAGGETLLDGGDGGDGGENKEAPEKGGESGSLLDDDQPNPENGGEPKPKEGGDDKGPTEEQVKAFTDGIKAIDLGEGVKWNDEALAAMTPELMKISGGDPKKVEGIVKAYTAHQQAQLKAYQEQQDKFNRSLIDEVRNRFGADTKKIVEFARIGGRAFFGDKIWNEMKKVPSFANNAEIIEKLAEYGRRIGTDDGKVVSKDGGDKGDKGDVMHRLYGNVKV